MSQPRFSHVVRALAASLVIAASPLGFAITPLPARAGSGLPTRCDMLRAQLRFYDERIASAQSDIERLRHPSARTVEAELESSRLDVRRIRAIIASEQSRLEHFKPDEDESASEETFKKSLTQNIENLQASLKAAQKRNDYWTNRKIEQEADALVDTPSSTEVPPEVVGNRTADLRADQSERDGLQKKIDAECGAQSTPEPCPSAGAYEGRRQLARRIARYDCKNGSDSQRWSGTWYNGAYTMQVSGGSGSLSYTNKRWDSPGPYEIVDQITGSCTVKGDVATCKEQAQYHDSEKTVSRANEVTMTLTTGATPADDLISASSVITQSSVTLKDGHPCPKVSDCTGMYPGARFSGYFSRKKR